MIEITSDIRPPPIPAVLRLRARYRGRPELYALHRRLHMGLRRPRNDERADIAAEKMERKRQTQIEVEEEKARRRAEEHAERVNIRHLKDAQLYPGRH